MYDKIYLKEKKEESLRRRHPWVFSGAVDHVEGNPMEGDIVRVMDSAGNFLAVGHCQNGSIAVRVLTFEDRQIDYNFWLGRLTDALAVRKTIGLIGNNNLDTCRLVHGEGDELPGLVVDLYGPTAVLQAHSVGMHLSRNEIAAALVEASNGLIKNVYYKSETTLPFKAELGQENGFIIGNTTNNIACENGLRFHIDWLKGQKTGFFTDQRESRTLLEHYSLNRRVLNMCCYTGGFSVYALRGGAVEVHSVDTSAKAVDMACDNVRLNFPDDTRHAAFVDDAFKYLDNAPENHYDLIILDPPAFAKHRDALRQALKGYTRLNTKALRKIKHKGILFTFSCSQVVSQTDFRTAVFTAAAISNRSVRILHQLHQPADHPVSIYHPEGEYLKGLVLYVE